MGAAPPELGSPATATQPSSLQTIETAEEANAQQSTGNAVFLTEPPADPAKEEGSVLVVNTVVPVQYGETDMWNNATTEEDLQAWKKYLALPSLQFGNLHVAANLVRVCLNHHLDHYASMP